MREWPPKTRWMLLIAVVLLALSNVTMIVVAPAWRHGAVAVVSLLLALVLTSAVAVLARGPRRGGR